jgi:aminopeptidase-like protein
VPFVEFTRCLDSDAPYREYHTSLDTADLMDAALLGESYEVLRQAIESLEQDARMHRRFEGLICLSNPDFDLYFERFDPAVEKALPADADKWGHLLDSLFRYFDGSKTVLEIAEKHELPFDRLHRYLRKFEQKALVDFERAPIKRPPISQPSAGRVPWV